MRCLCVSDRLEDGVYSLHSRFERVINYSDGRRLVSLVTPDVGAGPAHIVIEPPLPSAATWLKLEGATAQSEAGTIDLSPATIWDSRLLRATPDPAAVIRNLPALERALRTSANAHSLVFTLDDRRPSPSGPGVERATALQLKRGVETFRAGHALQGVALLKGCGRGLTPSGDDFIAGWLAAEHVAQRMGGGPEPEEILAVVSAACGGNLLSNAFLRWAAEGRAVERPAAVAHAVGFGGEKAVREAIERLCSWGATSGADWGVGFLMALRRWGEVSEGGRTLPAATMEAV